MPQTLQPTPRDWLVGGGEMGERIRSTDWSTTPFGPRASWPAPLRTVVNLLVGSQFPMALLWGRELLLLYNDAYREIAAEKHPRALGRSTREVWPEVRHINEPIFASVMDRGETVYLEDKLFPIDRHGRREAAYFTLCYSPVRADDGAVAGTLVTLLETTRRVQQHREQLERLRVSFENVALGIAEVGRDGRIQRVNWRLAALLGYQPDELRGVSIHDLTAPEDRERSRELNGRLLRGEVDSFLYEKRYLRRDRTPLWVRVTVSAIRDATGAVLRAIGTVEDITERKRVEDELERERTLLQGIFDTIPVLLVRWDPRLKRFALNRTAESVLGWSTAEANAGDLLAMVYPDPEYRARVATYMRSMQPGFREWTVTTKDGEHIPVEWANVRLRDDTAIGIGVDLRERKRVERSLRDALAKAEAGDRMLAALMGNVPEGISICDAAGKVQLVSHHGQELLGGPHLGKGLEDAGGEREVYGPDRHARMPAEQLPLARALCGETVHDFEAVETTSDGRELPLLCNAAPIRDESGQVVGAIVAWRDITERKRAEAALRRSEERLRLAQQVARIGSFEFNPQTSTASWSPELEALHGLPPGGYGGTYEQWASLVHPDDLRHVERQLRQALDKGAFEAEWRVVCPDGTLRWLVGRGRVFRDDDGKAVRLLGVNVDVTERKRAEEALRVSEERFRLVMEHMSEGVMLFNAEGNLTYQNPSSLRIHGLEAAQAAGIEAEELEGTWEAWDEAGRPLSPDSWPMTRVVRGEVVQNQVLHARRADGGREFDASYNGRPVYDSAGKLVVGFVTIRDISEEVRATRALREADRRKNEFLAVLSHELRNPLAPIKNSLYILERAAPGGQQAKRAQQVIDRQVLHLTRLIDDLLDVTRITRGKIRLQRAPVNLCDLVTRTAEDHRSIFSAAQVELVVRTCAPPLEVQGDETRLAQVVGNLLSNAAKFTPRGGRVELWLTPEDGTAAIHVRDTGAGIASNLLTKLFEPFVQADVTLDRSKGGLGLGLALVKGLVELHGGSVRARSDGPGQGAEFIVRLPRERVEEPSGAARRARARAGARRPLHVLLIEDNADAAETLKEALELNGHRVETAATGLEGLQKALALHPEVVLCDLGLPGIDGFEVARRIRRDPELRAACLVALSGYAAPEDLERSKEAGFVHHLAKPPDLDALEQTLSGLCAPQAPPPEPHPVGGR